METMKAVVFEKVGGPEVLQVRDIPVPKPDQDQALLRVRACALNLLDYYLRIEDDPEMPMPHVLGSDIAGEIVQTGPGVTGWHKGDPVIVAAAIERPGDRPHIIGYQTQGGYAQFAVVPAKNLLRKPPSLSFEQAASLPLAYVTAYRQAVTHGRVQRDDVVLVTGASGGVGSACVQICKAFGAFVLGTTSSEEKVSQLRSSGADAAVVQDTGWQTKVTQAAGGRAPTLICDNVGGSTLEQAFSIIAHGGRLVSVGSTTGGEVKIGLSDLFRKEAQIIGSYMGTTQELAEVIKLVERGAVKPVVGKVFPLAEAASAHRWMESRKHFGKIVLTIP